MSISYSKEVSFEPWVGVNYDNNESIFSKKVLVLGGSHYGQPGEEDPDFTNEIVKLYLDDSHKDTWKGTYSKFINSIYFKVANLDERKDLLDSVVFYNYLQDFAGDTHDKASQYDYKDPRHFEAFLSVIDTHKPDIVIAWGKYVWDALPDEWRHGDANQESGITIAEEKIEKCYVYPYAGNSKVTLLGINHPSGGYSWEPHHEKFKALGIYK